MFKSHLLMLVTATNLVVAAPGISLAEHKDDPGQADQEEHETITVNPKIRFHQQNDHFQVSGTIQTLTATTITIDGKLIHLDATVTHHLNEVGTLTIGAFAHVEGIIDNGMFFARILHVQPSVTIKTEEAAEVNEETAESAELTRITSPSPAVSTPPERVHETSTHFQLAGIVTAQTDRTFTVVGQTVTLDEAVTGTIHEEGQVVVGAFVHVEGTMIDGKLFAKTIQVLPKVSVVSTTTERTILERVMGQLQTAMNSLAELLRSLI